jgi:hypothetical protein
MGPSWALPCRTSFAPAANHRNLAVVSGRRAPSPGITPGGSGGRGKWPLHFYTALPMMRILGKDGTEAIYQDKNGGRKGGQGP